MLPGYVFVRACNKISAEKRTLKYFSPRTNPDVACVGDWRSRSRRSSPFGVRPYTDHKYALRLNGPSLFQFLRDSTPRFKTGSAAEIQSGEV